MRQTNTVYKPLKGPFSENSSAGSGSGSLSMLSEYESEWPPLTVGASSLAGGKAVHNCPTPEAEIGSPLLKLLASTVAFANESACCCCFCKAAWDERKITLSDNIGTQSKGLIQPFLSFYNRPFLACPCRKQSHEVCSSCFFLSLHFLSAFGSRGIIYVTKFTAPITLPIEMGNIYFCLYFAY